MNRLLNRIMSVHISDAHHYLTSDFSGTRFLDSQEERRAQRRTILKCTIWSLCYIIIGSFIYSYWMHISYVDASYYVVVTFTTVGYGDIDEVNVTRGQKIFTIFFILFGVCGMLSIFVTVLSESFFTKMELISSTRNTIKKKYEKDMMGGMTCRRVSKLLREISEDEDDDDSSSSDDDDSNSNSDDVDDSDSDTEDYGMQQQQVVEECAVVVKEEESIREKSIRGNQEKDEKKKNEKSSNNKKRSRLCDVLHAIYLNIPCLILIILPACLIGFIEGWHIVDIFYFAIVTATTVGYGDLTPEKIEMRIFSIFYLPFCIIVMTRVISNVSGVYLERKAKAAEREYIENRHLSRKDINHMDTIYGNGDGEVSYDEFLSFMLVAMQKVEHDDILLLKKLYKDLDYEGNGKLTTRDVHSLFKEAEKRAVTNTTAANTATNVKSSLRDVDTIGKKKKRKSRKKGTTTTTLRSHEKKKKISSSEIKVSSDNNNSSVDVFVKDEEIGEQVRIGEGRERV